MQNHVFFHTQSLDFELNDPTKYEVWIQEIAKSHEANLDTLNFIFCTDEELLVLNKEYLNHDYYTDILSFPLELDPIAGDIFISIERVKENAMIYKIDFHTELLRVMAHGFLHFMGFDDHSEHDIAKMRAAESQAISLFS